MLVIHNIEREREGDDFVDLTSDFVCYFDGGGDTILIYPTFCCMVSELQTATLLQQISRIFQKF